MGQQFSCRSEGDPDSAFKLQNKATQDNPLYKYVNIDNTGELVDIYRNDGKERVKEIIQREIEPKFLYGIGGGQTITTAEYANWFQNGRSEDESVDCGNGFKVDDFSVFKPHEACWALNKRGGVGETPFHLCYLMGTKVHTEIAKIFLELYPKMCLDVYEGKEYFGESSLHIAIVYNDIESVKLLVDKGANVNQRATGQFFLPEDVKHGTHPLKTNYEGFAYYGEYPLAFAACFNHQEIYDYLIDNGANPNVKDSFGNTVLHMVVIVNQPKMYKHAVKHPKFNADKTILNNTGLTALTLASKLGRHQIFLEMLELDCIPMWKYSNIACSMYSLEALDSIGPLGEANWKSALNIIVDRETDGHSEMLEGGVMRQLLDEKWKTYAQSRFLLRLGIACIHLAMISVCVYTRPIRQNLLLSLSDADVARFVFEILTCLLCLASLLMEAKEFGSVGLWALLRNWKHAPDQAIYLISCVLILFCIPFRFANLPDVEDTLLTIAVPGSFMYLLFFARVHRLTGPFVTIVYQMCVRDLLRFGIVYTIFLIGFTQGFFFLFRDVVTDNTEVLKFSTFADTIMNLFQMTLGEFKYETFNYARYVILTKLVFVIFMILVPILLLNMLIAMMGHTYHNIITKSEKEWRRQWAKIVIVLERGFLKKQLLKFQQEYSIEFSDIDVNPPKRALVVIKAASKSCAKQAKAARANWKKAVKSVVIQLNLHKQKCSKKPFHLKKTKKRHVKEFQRTNTSSSLVDKIPDMTSMVEQIAWVNDINIDQERAVSSGHKESAIEPLPALRTKRTFLDNRVYPSETLSVQHSNMYQLSGTTLTNQPLVNNEGFTWPRQPVTEESYALAQKPKKPFKKSKEKDRMLLVQDDNSDWEKSNNHDTDV